MSSGFSSSNIKVILDEEAALKEALDTAEPSDIVIIFFEDYAPLLKLIKTKIADRLRQVSLV